MAKIAQALLAPPHDSTQHLPLKQQSTSLMTRRTTALAAALSLLPLGQPLLLGSTTALATAAVVLSTQAAHAQSAGEFFNRGNAKIKSKDYQGAIADYNEAIEIDPKNALIYNNRGFAKQLSVDEQDADAYMLIQEAIADYTMAISINPQFALAYTNRGNTKYDLRDYQGAIADYNKAIEIDPQDAFAYVHRGYAKSNLKDYQGAIADYTKAIEINPQYADAYYNRGIDKELVGDLKGACADWKEASSLGDKGAADWVRVQCQ